MKTQLFQFTLKNALVVMALLCALFASVARAGPLGAVVFVGVFGIFLICFAGLKKNRCYAIVGGLLTVAATLTLALGGTVAVGDGRATLSCNVRVVDRDGNPVRVATVYLRDVTELWDPPGVPEWPIPMGEWSASGDTNARGTVTIGFEIPVTSRSGPLIIDETYVLIMQNHWVQVDAAGYERKFIPLETVFGRKYDWNDLPLPQITVRLSANDAQ